MGGPWEAYQQQPARGPWEDYAQPTQPAAPPPTKKRGWLEGIAQGATDPLLALGQVGIGIREALGIPSEVSGAQAKDILRKREADITSSRGADAGIDWARTAGNVVAGLPLMAIPGGPVAGGIAAGAASGALQPAMGEGNLAVEKLKQAGLGAAAGGAGGAVAGGLAGLIGGARGAIPGAVQALRKEGVTPTIGTAAGGIAKNAEEAFASLPFAGTPIREAQQRATESLNVAAYNRALAPIGEKITKGKLGGDAVAEVSSKLSDAYEAVKSRLNFQPTSEFLSDLATVVKAGDELPEAQAKQLERLVKSFSKAKDFKEAETKLSGWVSRYIGAADPDQRALGQVIKGMRATLRSHLEQQNPAEAANLQAINRGWANFARVRDAASRLGAEDNVFTAAQLQNAVRAADKSRGRGDFAKGQAMMQDLSQPAKRVMSRPFGSSGTPERTSYTNPIALALGALGYLPAKALYSNPGQIMATALLTARPQQARAIAELLRRTGPSSGLLGGSLVGSGLLPAEPY